MIGLMSEIVDLIQYLMKELSTLFFLKSLFLFIMFNEDLKLGHRFEEFVLKRVRLRYPNAKRIDGEYKGGDIYIPEINEMVECKFDRMAHKTGNIALEVGYKGNPSGIVTSKSKWWAVGIKKGFFIILTEELKMTCVLYDTINGGDNGNSKIKLIPIDDLVRTFKLMQYS